MAVDPEPALTAVRAATAEAAERVLLDIDCDVFDPVYFPAVTNPVPFGLSPTLLLRFIEAAWSEPRRRAWPSRSSIRRGTVTIKACPRCLAAGISCC